MSHTKGLSIATVAVLGLFAMGTVAAPAPAAELKIGVVDMQKAIQSVDAGKKARAKLESDYNKKKDELQKEEASIKKAHEELQKASLVMSEKALAKKQAEIQQRIMKFQEKTMKSQQEIQAREQELTKPIVEKMRSIITGLAKDKGYTVILEKNENAVLFSEDKDDLTKDVISKFNKG